MAKALHTVVALLLGALVCTGCAGQGEGPAERAAHGGSQVVAALTGKLVLKGNMPMFQTVLVQDSGQQWELQGVSQVQAEGLQNKIVLVEGFPGPTVATGSLRRTFKVRTILAK